MTRDQGAQPILWYFADPMCSWCWGFAPVVEQVKAAYGGRLRIALMLGGLRPGTTEPMSAALREEILHHWHEVHRRTGQPFRFEGALPQGFVYDTEPASRAVVAFASLQPERTLDYFGAVQAAFYRDGRDVTTRAVLADLATSLGLDSEQFVERFDSDAIRERVQAHFYGTRHAGVTGFPTLLWQSADRQEVLVRGHVPFQRLNDALSERCESAAAVDAPR